MMSSVERLALFKFDRFVVIDARAICSKPSQYFQDVPGLKYSPATFHNSRISLAKRCESPKLKDFSDHVNCSTLFEVGFWKLVPKRQMRDTRTSLHKASASAEMSNPPLKMGFDLRGTSVILPIVR
jgi:hypothetical protein